MCKHNECCFALKKKCCPFHDLLNMPNFNFMHRDATAVHIDFCHVPHLHGLFWDVYATLDVKNEKLTSIQRALSRICALEP
jgi:hypothetical protein